jgi:putative peptide zinc metalloprotease protein
MGVGVYLVWPAFYTDVTDAYRLSKSGRLRTDLGGVYFNAIFTLLTAGAYFATGFEPLLLVIALQHAEILHQFLPVVRLDGYYIVSDLAGVPDMFRRVGPTLKSLLPWRRPDPAVAELKRWVRIAVSAYVLTVVPLLLFVLLITVMNMPRVLATSWDSGSLELQKIQHAADSGAWLSVASGSIQLAVLVLIPAGLLLTLLQLGRRVAERAWKATEDRPAARRMLIAVAAGAAAFTAYTWFPAVVYRPIQPGEKGTLRGAFAEVGAVTSGRPALTAERERELPGAGFRGDERRSPPRRPTTPGTIPRNKPVTPSQPKPSNSPPVQPPRATVSTPVATVTTPGATVSTPTLPSPAVTTPTLPAVSVTTPTLPAVSVTTPTLPTPTVTTPPPAP